MSVSLITLRSNRNFLDYYHDYIKREWRRHYFSYDVLKEEYKALKWKDKPKLHRFERDFLEEIKRVDWFIKATLFEIQQDLRKISETKALFLDEMQMAKRKAQDEKTVEITLRAIYEKCNDIEQFYSLNRFAICKIAKKFEKLIDQSLLDDSHKDEADGFIDFDPWRDHKSNEYFTQKFVPREKIIQALSNKCKAMYKLFFRRRYPTLAEGELDFVKNKARIHKSTQVLFGMKVGAIILLIIWLVVDSNTQSNDFDFWEQPGLFVYTTVGNLLFFRFLWSANVYLWSRFDINYIPLLSLSNNRPNTLMIVNTTSTWMLLYCVNLLVFYFDNESVSDTAITKRSYICPMLLVAWTLGAEAFDYFYRFGPNSRFSRGLFSRRVIYRCVTAPLSALQFRDIYAADVMTSFTKVISDTLYATCWFLSGAFRTPHDNELDQTISSSTDFGSSYMQCTSQQMVYCVVLFECIPLWIRFLQCCRQSYDGQGQVWPFGFNALKYLLSMLVVLMGVRRTVSSDDVPYVTLIVITALYKWWWDVVMDWGLFDVLPAWCAPFCPMATSSIEAARSKPLTGGATGETTSNSNKSDSSSSGKQPSALLEDDRPHLFLRKQLMYPYVGVYYVCIFLDLILRFLWVVSLVPESIFGSFVGPQLSLFLGSMEIFRRAMWGCFRLEYEHLKHVTKGSPGFLKFRRVEYLLPGSKVSQRYDFGGTDRPETSGDGGDHRSSFRLSVELADDSVQDLERILEASTNVRKSKVLATGAADPAVVKMLGEIDGDVEVDDDDNDADDHRGDTNDPGSFSSVYSMQTLPSAAVVSNPLNAQQLRGAIHAPPYSSRGESMDITIASRMVSIDHGADV